MIRLNKKLKELDKNKKYIKVGLIGAGLMGTGMVSQISLVKGMKASIVADRTLEKAINAFLEAGIDRKDIITSRDLNEINKELDNNKFIATDKIELVWESNINVVVDATGNPEAGAEIALNTITNNKHIVLLNVETDSVVGPILNIKAREKGVVYTGTAGDEPGSIKELYDFAKLSGFEVIAVGKGKNNKIDYDANPRSVKKQALSSNLKPKMLAGFVDGTNTMIEMTVVANSIGFKPDIPGGHGVTAKVEELPHIFQKINRGGILKNTKVVDYVNGIAPGVFVIVTSNLPRVHSQMKFLKMGDGPNYILYRPYHLTSLETPITIARAALDKIPTIAPEKGPVCQTIAVAKKDLKTGEFLDGIGGYTVYGTIYNSDQVRKENLLPIGLINEKTSLKVDVNKGQLITRDMVNIDENRLLYKLYEEQERYFK